jgi:hypothetical protein
MTTRSPRRSLDDYGTTTERLRNDYGTTTRARGDQGDDDAGSGADDEGSAFSEHIFQKSSGAGVSP